MTQLKRICLALVLPLFLGPAHAQDQDAETPSSNLFLEADDVDISEFQWVNRLVVVFADSPADPRFVQQMDLLEALPKDLQERDVVVLTDTAPATPSALRLKYRPRGFMMLLVGKDGNVYLRKPLPWDVREISRSIDKMPLRQQEIRDRRLTQ